MPDRTCPICGGRIKGRSDKRFCSVNCRNKCSRDRNIEARIQAERAYNARRTRPRGLSERQRQARRKLRKAARGTSGKGNRWVQGSCRRCGSTFVALGNGPGLAAYCSDRCQHADVKERRRARKMSASVGIVSRADVFTRDGFVCQLCKRSVRRSAVVPHPLAPTLDHIVPLSRGGEHSMANLQTAHFLCNSTKGARVANDQLRLIG